MKYFESTLKSLANVQYKVQLYSKSYEGINAPVIGGSGTTFYLKYDWTDYLENGQALYQTVGSGGSDFVISFLYNSAEDRTEVTMLGAVYSSQTVLRNNPDVAQSFVPVFAPKIIDLKTEWKDIDENILCPLMPSSTTLDYANVIEDSNDDPPKTAFFDRFLDDYIEANDDELRVVIYKYVSSAYVLQWAGNLVADLIEWEDASSPRQYTFKAIDGIQRLKDVEYAGDLASLSLKKVIDIIKDVLALNDLDQFWGATDDYIYESIEFKTTDIASITAASSPLDYSYLPENLLIPKNQNEGKVEFMSGYDILKGIMQLFSAKMYISDGKYWITQARNYDTTAFTIRKFDKTNNSYGNSAYTHSDTGLRVMSGGTFSNFYGIKRSIITTDSGDLISASDPSAKFNIEWGYYNPASSVGTALVSANGTTAFPANLSYNVGAVKDAVSNGSTFDISFFLDPASSRSASIFSVEVRLFINDGTQKYLKGGNGVTPFWGNDSVTADRYWTQTFTSGANVEFSTPPMIYDLSDCTVGFTFIVSAPSIPSPLVMNKVYDLSNIKIYVLTDDNINNNIISVVNANTKFTKDLEFEKLLINEGTSLVTINNINVDENYLAGGGVATIPVNSWDGDYDIDPTLAKLRLMDAMAIQYRPLQKYFGQFEGDYMPHQSIPYNDKAFITKRIMKSYLMDENNGDWFESNLNTTGISPTSTVDTKDGRGVSGQGQRKARTYIDNKEQIGTLTADISAATITSIQITLLQKIKKGDFISLIDDVNDTTFEFEVSANASIGTDVTVSVVSIAIGYDVVAGGRIINSYKKLLTSDVVRANYFMTNNSGIIPSELADMKDGEIRIVDESIFTRKANIIFVHTGTVFTP